MDGPTRERFERLCREAKGLSGVGLTLDEIADCAVLAEELGAEPPDTERVGELRRSLGLEESAPDEQTSLSLEGRAA